MTADQHLENAIASVKKAADAAAMENDPRASEWYDLMADLIRTRDPELAALMDAERLDRARVVG